MACPPHQFDLSNSSSNSNGRFGGGDDDDDDNLEYKLWMSPDSTVSVATGWTAGESEFEFQ